MKIAFGTALAVLLAAPVGSRAQFVLSSAPAPLLSIVFPLNMPRNLPGPALPLGRLPTLLPGPSLPAIIPTSFPGPMTAPSRAVFEAAAAPPAADAPRALRALGELARPAAAAPRWAAAPDGEREAGRSVFDGARR